MEIRLAVRKRCIYFTNLVIALSFGLGVYAFYMKGEPFIQGFYCNDESIDKPFKTSTIPSVQGAIVIATLAVFFFASGEFIKVSEKRKICNEEGKKHSRRWLVNVVFLIFKRDVSGAPPPLPLHRFQP